MMNTAMIYGWRHVLPDVAAVEVKELLGLDHVPDLWAMAHDVDLVFFNALPILDGVRPLNPNTIQVGGLHAVPPKPLTGDLRKWIDGAEHGVIYVSFGSVSIP